MAYRPKTLSETLFNLVIDADWDSIVEIYEDNPDAHTTKITKSGYSALHLAVQDGKDEVVKTLVGLILESHPPDNFVEVLGLKNKRGDTPLHFAASMGNLRMCYELAHSKPELIGLGNAEGETPLFVAAANGKKEAFLCLHSLIPEAGREETGMLYGIRANGDTLLHCALDADGDYFDLAFQIIHRFPGLGNRENGQGRSPLHLLASNPSVFRSGSQLGFIDTIIYNCTFVNRLTVDPEETSNFHCPTPQTENKRPSTECAETPCVLFRGLFQSLCCWRSIAEIKTDAESQVPDRQRNQVFLPNYDVTYDFLKLVSKAMFIILGVGHRQTQLMREKEKHTWSVQIMEEILEEDSEYLYVNRGDYQYYDITDSEPVSQEESSSSKVKAEMVETLTPILLAAKNGITEMVKSILIRLPVAINDMNVDKRNIVLLAVEHGQVDVYKILLSLFKKNDRVFQKVDREGNSALHIAAFGRHIPWLASGAALQLQKRYMWYEFVKRSKPWDFFPKYNKRRMTALEILNESSQGLIEDANKWMGDAAQSCSLVAVLVATIAYTTSAGIPGGFKGGDSGGKDSGLPVLGGHAMFDVFAISGDVAFVLSVMALVLFLPVFSTYNQVSHFRTAAPPKLWVGLTLLLLSLTAVMVSFSAAESFIVVNGNLKFMKFIIFAATCFPIILVANQFLSFKLLS